VLALLLGQALEELGDDLLPPIIDVAAPLVLVPPLLPKPRQRLPDDLADPLLELLDRLSGLLGRLAFLLVRKRGVDGFGGGSLGRTRYDCSAEVQLVDAVGFGDETVFEQGKLGDVLEDLYRSARRG